MDGLIVSGEREIRQADLSARAARAASGFRAIGIGENDAVALVLRNDFPFFEAAMGAGLIGAYAVPVNWHFTADEAGHVLRDCAAKAVVIHADLLPRIAAAIPQSATIFVVPTPPEIRAVQDLRHSPGEHQPGRRDQLPRSRPVRQLRRGVHHQGDHHLLRDWDGRHSGGRQLPHQRCDDRCGDFARPRHRRVRERLRRNHHSSGQSGPYRKVYDPQLPRLLFLDGHHLRKLKLHRILIRHGHRDQRQYDRTLLP